MIPAASLQAHEPRTIGPYEVVALLGRGGMGNVYAARQPTAYGLSRWVALKVLGVHLLDDQRFVDMFLDEARIAIHLRHPHVVDTLDVAEYDGKPVIVMELLHGQSLDRVLQRQPAPPLSLRCAILSRAVRGLLAVHETRGADGAPLAIVHRDVTPQNIHLGYDGQVKLIDFGIAAARGRVTKTRTGEVKGKLAYLAPEQLAQGNIDCRTDLFAFGVVAWEVLTGRRLFRERDEASTMLAVLNKRIPRLDEVVPDVAPEVAEIIEACLQREPRNRPTSAREVARVLADAAGPRADEDAIAQMMQTSFAQEIEQTNTLLKSVQRLTPGLDAEADRSASMPVQRQKAGSDPDAVTRSSVAPPVQATSSRLRWAAPAGIAGLLLAWQIGSAHPKAPPASNDSAAVALIAPPRAPEVAPRRDPVPELTVPSSSAVATTVDTQAKGARAAVSAEPRPRASRSAARPATAATGKAVAKPSNAATPKLLGSPY